MSLVKRKLPERTAVGNATVLIAEDDPHDRMLLQMAVDDSGARLAISYVENGEAALERLRELRAAGIPVEMIVLDMRMPRLDGHEVLEVLAADPDLCPRRVGVFSTSHRQQDIDRSLDLGAAWHVVKPSRYDQLVDFVRMVESECDA